MLSEAENPFEGKLRPRACGLVVKDNRLLMVKINAPTRPGSFWMPPGGGISFGETMEDAAEREVKEETGLVVKASGLVFISEYINQKWHALEFYFRCNIVSGVARLGSDPEIASSAQMLEDIGWFDAAMIEKYDVFPEFINHHKAEILSDQTMPLRMVKQ